MDLISVIVPVYNVEQYLIRCVDSIRKQTYQNLEIILVDDGSPDRCPQLCDEIKFRDSRVKVIHKKNGGQGLARNSGLDIAAGTYVTFIDADDWISEDHIENLYREAKRTAADVVIGSHTSVSMDGTSSCNQIKIKKQIYEGAAVKEEIVLPLIGADVNYLQDVQLESSSSMSLYRLDVIKSNNIQFRSEKEAVAEDLFFNIDFCCNANRVAVIDEFGYYYFQNMSSTSRKYDPNRFRRTIKFYEVLKAQVAEHQLVNRVDFRVERSFLMKVRVAIRLIVFSDLPQREKIHQIQCILDHQLVRSVLRSYPINTYIPAMRLLAKAMLHGNARCVCFLMQIREYAKNTELLKNLLKTIGIGK